ncbi:Prostatic acid phosphatase [Pseudolycoriella hygida]|uniref:acid phosphatase n=1 Tax=Pseudolycoriella hygida TaxID=35572 RepID=A0A9Q0MYT7_9DIPT|nr:Prostatic acid phosphatase [Pseudolycoriella hygida]
MYLAFTFVVIFYVADFFVLCETNSNSHLHNDDDSKGDLLFVQLIFRHGDRTPLRFYENDPWKDPKYWEDDLGQLTNVGKRQIFELGLFMRERYATFISETYSENDIYVQSSDIDRAIMSAEAFLAGMFLSNASVDIWKTYLPWTPIPVHTMPRHLDCLILGSKSCAAYKEEFGNFIESEKIKEFNRKHKDLYDFLSLHSGNKVKKMDDCVPIWDALKIEDAHNKTLPKWTEEIFPGGRFYDSIQEVTLNAFSVDTGTPFLAKIKGGFLLKDIFDRFTNKSKSILDPNRKLWVFSGHDTTISRVLNTLGLLQVYPPVATCIIFEMRNIQNVPHVEMFIKNSTTAIPLQIPNCGLSCPLDKLYILYENILPAKSFEDECNVEKGMHSKASENAVHFILQIATFAVLLTQSLQASQSTIRLFY